MRKKPSACSRIAAKLGLIAAILLAVGCNGRMDEPAAEAKANGTGTRTDGKSGNGTPTLQLSEAAAKNATLTVARAATTSLTEAVSIPGELQARGDALVVVTARSAGTMSEVAANVGDRVEAGQAIGRITSLELAQEQAGYRESLLVEQRAIQAQRKQQTLARGALVQARARLETARRQAERARSLGREGIVSRQDDESAQTALAEARQALREAEVQYQDASTGSLASDLARARQSRESSAQHIGLLGGSKAGTDGGIPVIAPISGRIVEREVTRGQAVDRNAVLFRIVDARKLIAVLESSEDLAYRVKAGAPVRFRVDSLPGRTFLARVKAPGDVVAPRTRKVAIICSLDNPGGVLKPGMFVSALLPVGQYTGVAVPQTAVQTLAASNVVFVSLGEHRFERREVETGLRADGRVAVKTGLRPDEAVVVDGAFWLKSEFQKSEMEE